jgi:hypothetical protein
MDASPLSKQKQLILRHNSQRVAHVSIAHTLILSNLRLGPFIVKINDNFLSCPEHVNVSGRMIVRVDHHVKAILSKNCRRFKPF